MKKVKKTLSVLFILSLLIGVLGVTALATGSNTITINSETSGHTYQAYQVFTGTYSDTNVLSNVAWGSGVNSTNLLSVLKSDGTYGSDFLSCSSAADVAKVISTNYSADTAFASAFAKLIAVNLSGTPATSTESGSGPYVYTITGLTDGYYFANEAAFSTDPADNAYTKYLLKVVDDVTVTAKTDKPAIALKVLENNDGTYKDTWNDAADYNIGDNVPYRIVSIVPDMSNFDTYYYQIADTISTGSTFDSTSVNVYYVPSGSDMYNVETSTSPGAGGTLIDSSRYTPTNTGNDFTVTFDDLKSTSGVTGAGYIVIEYTAELDSDAVIENPGNPTEVFLTYSNNPNDSASGSTAYGQTPKDEVVVYTLELPVSKTDGSNALTGATFAIFNSISDANAAVSDPTALTNALTFTGSAGTYTRGGSEKVLESDAGGDYSIKGLDQGTYYLVEIAAPIGYNRLDVPKTVTVDPSYNDELATRTSAYVDGHTPDVTDQLNSVAVNGGAKVTVINQAGSTLPETGGIGTTIFKITGLTLILGAAVLAVTKRKMSSRNEK